MNVRIVLRNGFTFDVACDSCDVYCDEPGGEIKNILWNGRVDNEVMYINKNEVVAIIRII